MIYLQLFLSFLKIGLFGFGGGLAIFSLIQHEIEVHGWMIKAPYYLVAYVDDWNQVHMAMIKDLAYLHFIEDRFYVKECRFIER